MHMYGTSRRYKSVMYCLFFSFVGLCCDSYHTLLRGAARRPRRKLGYDATRGNVAWSGTEHSPVASSSCVGLKAVRTVRRIQLESWPARGAGRTWHCTRDMYEDRTYDAAPTLVWPHDPDEPERSGRRAL